ncbi:hypothetical protein EXU48_18195 [Occultella glacieicola]|uniref:DUF3558 domain-containing protein n=1 Tax=Occultella glacieicola TaxID=2518684 RepID=A0ABY2E0Y7_9MICO|nr:hypothetical protein [Occultella glacieicola]TDE90385.1 hypothetical protein EXU48_18195 [Occultella glacieicola]
MTARTLRRLGVLLAGAALLAGCATATGDQSDPGGDGPAGAGRGSGSGGMEGGPTAPPSVPPGFLECPDQPGDEELQLADVDLTTAVWATPTGWADASGYSEDNPIEEILENWVGEPVDEPLPRLNVGAVVIYGGLDWTDLADQCGRVPITAIEEQLGRYRDQIGAEPLSEVERLTIAGLPALHQDIRLTSYDYTGYWVFSENQLLHAYCQWTDEAYRAPIEDGCLQIVESLTVG